MLTYYKREANTGQKGKTSFSLRQQLKLGLVGEAEKCCGPHFTTKQSTAAILEVKVERDI